MGKIEDAVNLIKQIAADDSHGYSQINRDGNPDYDCSSLVIDVLRKSGFALKGATYTGDMLKALKADGFVDVVKEVDLESGSGLKNGDILLTPGKHVAMVTGKKKITHARIDEVGDIVGKKKGDQTGNEIAETSYYNKPWKHVLRFSENEKKPEKENSNIENLVIDAINGKYGNGDERKKKLGSNYDKVQKRINEYYDYAYGVIRGDYPGTPADGFDLKVINDIYYEYRKCAYEVIRGSYGNGEERKANLKKAGYNAEAVQKLVNRLLWRI